MGVNTGLPKISGFFILKDEGGRMRDEQPQLLFIFPLSSLIFGYSAFRLWRLP
jgi:hypothetical protein